MNSPTVGSREPSRSVGVSGATKVPAVPVTRSHLRLTRRGRIVIGCAVSIPIVALVGSLLLHGSSATASGASGSGSGLLAGSTSATSTSATSLSATSTGGYRYVQVEAGQSLWQLAVALAPSDDPRDVVSDIVRLNDLPTAVVQPGQSIAIPTSYSK